jgi:hypothetical protein
MGGSGSALDNAVIESWHDVVGDLAEVLAWRS